MLILLVTRTVIRGKLKKKNTYEVSVSEFGENGGNIVREPKTKLGYAWVLFFNDNTMLKEHLISSAQKFPDSQIKAIDYSHLQSKGDSSVIIYFKNTIPTFNKFLYSLLEKIEITDLKFTSKKILNTETLLKEALHMEKNSHRERY